MRILNPLRRPRVFWQCQAPAWFTVIFFIEFYFRIMWQLIELFFNFSCLFLNLNHFFQFEFLILLLYFIWKTSRKKLEDNSVSKIVPNFHCSNKLFFWFLRFCKKKNSHKRSEQFWNQNTISYLGNVYIDMIRDNKNKPERVFGL